MHPIEDKKQQIYEANSLTLNLWEQSSLQNIRSSVWIQL